MKRYWLLLLPVFLIFTFLYRDQIITTVNGYVYQSPCDTPIPYHIGAVDERFNITEDEFGQYIQDAGEIWNSTSGKRLFTYEPDSVLTFNLIYDERQSLNNQINELNNDLDQQKKTINPEIQAYESRSANFRKRVTALNQEISSWNEKGGAPPEEYKRLTEEQTNLQQEAKELNALAAQLNQTTDYYNTQVEELHQTVDTYNETLQYKPEEGLYIVDGNKEEIDIFFYNSKDEIVHTLAHEMGHALDLPHINNPSSIMFPQTNKVLSPSPEDMAQLSIACQKQNMIKVNARKFLILVHDKEVSLLNYLKNQLENLKGS